MVLSQHSQGGTEEGHEKRQREQPMSRPRVELGTSPIHARTQAFMTGLAWFSQSLHANAGDSILN
jgi:hypothetical protein